MDFFEPKTQMEHYLRQRCEAALQPFAGVLELMPGCSTEQWISIIDQAAEMGVYALRLSGREPLTHPDFKTIYAHLCDKGIAVTLDTDGILLDEDTLAFLQKYRGRQVNLFLLGADNETYARSCGISDGFDRVTEALNLLKTYHMPVSIRVQLTQHNIGQIDSISRIAKDLGYPVDFSAYCFPKDCSGTSAELCRISPEEAANAAIKCFLLNNPQADYLSSCRYTLSKLANPTRFTNSGPGFTCHAAKSDFWITSEGEMLPCGMFRHEGLHYNLSENSFADCWSQMVTDTTSCSCVCEDCLHCGMRDLCLSCPAACHAETGSMTCKPEYLCRMTEETIRICREAIDESSSEKPLVSIIVPVYNVEPYISQCIDSFLKQTFSAWEMILIDDGSTDRSGELCDQYAVNDDRIKVIHQPNRGVSAARNQGLAIAAADYILFCDSDDFVEPDYCRVLYHTIKDRPDAFITANTWCGTDDSPRQIQIGSDYADPNHITVDEARHNPVFAYVWNSIYSKKIITDHNIRFDENCSYNEDIQFNKEYIQYCQNGVFICNPLYVHLVHETGLVYQEFKRRGMKLEDLKIQDYGELQSINPRNK